MVAGGLACGVYTTSSAAAVEYKLQHGRADILVLEDAEQLDKVTMGIYYYLFFILRILIQVSEARRRQLRAVVQYSGEAAAGSGVMTWAQLLELGSEQPGAALQGRLEQQAVNMACMLVYTSGTTGQAVN